MCHTPDNKPVAYRTVSVLSNNRNNKNLIRKEPYPKELENWIAKKSFTIDITTRFNLPVETYTEHQKSIDKTASREFKSTAEKNIKQYLIAHEGLIQYLLDLVHSTGSANRLQGDQALANLASAVCSDLFNITFCNIT